MASSLTGRLLTWKNTPARGYFVVVFPTDPALWSPGSGRMPPPIRSSADGGFRFDGLDAGSYYVTAMKAVHERDLADPSILAALKNGAVTVTLAEGEEKVHDVKFARVPWTPFKTLPRP